MHAEKIILPGLSIYSFLDVVLLIEAFVKGKHSMITLKDSFRETKKQECA